MRTFVIFLFLSGNLIAQSAGSSYPISEVKVYKEGAEIERSASLNLKAGPNTLLFENLSSQLDPNSIQVKGLASLNLLSISHSVLSDDSIKQHPSITSIKKLVADNRLEQQDLIDEKEGLLLERKYLELNSSVGGSEGYTLTQLREISLFVKQQRSSNAKALSKLDLGLRKLQVEMVALEKELNQKITALQSTRLRIHATVISPKAQRVTLTIVYQIFNAGWSSTYDLKVASVDKPVNLAHKAIIYQSSGEDWNNVSLALNTGSMRANGQIPKLSPQYLFPLSNVNIRGARANEIAAPLAYRDSRSKSLDEDRDDLLASNGNSIQTNLLSRNFVIANKVTIASGKSATNLLRNLEIPAHFEYQSIPKIDASAYLIARVVASSDYNLEAGEIALYNDGNFVGKSYLNPNGSDDTLELSLGKDADIIVSRDQLKEESGNSFLGSRKTAKYAYELKVFNKKTTAIKLVLIDQFPVAQHEDIKVETNLGNIKLSNLTQGEIRWRLDIPAKQKITKKHQYQISYPKDMRLNY